MESESTAVWAGAYVLTIATTIPAAGVTVELHSTYTGHPWDGDHPALDTHSTHLELGPTGCPPQITTATHSPHNIDPLYRPRECAYDHAHRLLELLDELGFNASVDISDDAFRQLEAIRP